ncbi:MAG: hypothetical protein KC516_03770 [Nanoarchaeota archaeon]|nr:hypothetical protein [Nanoarchaeota archaeon]
MKENKLERISWKNKSWKKEDGTKVNPEKIGGSFIIQKTKDLFEKENLLNVLNNQLDKYVLEGLIYKSQRKQVNAYSIGELREGGFFELSDLPVSFYKI